MVYLFKMVIFHGYATNNQRVEAKFMDLYTSLLFKKKTSCCKNHVLHLHPGCHKMMPVTAHLQDHIALSPDLKISHEPFRTSTYTSSGLSMVIISLFRVIPSISAYLMNTSWFIDVDRYPINYGLSL